MNRSVDLGNCDREPIHIPGQVQPFGFLIGVAPDLTICMVSANIADHLGRDWDDVKERPLQSVLAQNAHEAIRKRLDYLAGPDAVERLFGLDLLNDGKRFDCAIHFSGPYLILEFEPSTSEVDVNSGELVRSMLTRIRATDGVTGLARETVRQMKILTGFDRVMVYRFHADGSGEVIAEAGRDGLESFLGLRYPASDIPRQARQLYQRNWLRIIADVGAKPAALISLPSHNAQLLDLSMSVLRAVSPIHIEYLQNIGVAASMSVSILQGGQLWGLIACHHYAPRHLSFERRTASELFGQMFSWVLEGRERERDFAYQEQATRLQEKLVEHASLHAQSHRSISDFVDEYRKMIRCDGLAIWCEEHLTTAGQTPSEPDVKELVAFVNRISPGKIYGTAEIGKVFAAGHAFRDQAAGMLAIPISREPRDCLLFFRREVVKSVNWAGDPNKAYGTGPHGDRLTPRKSFELWRETVRGQSEPWSEADLAIAERLRVTLLEFVLQLADLAVRERKAAQERQELMIAELNHRVRNILGLVRGLIAQSGDGASSLEEFVRVLGGRIQALARAHDQITTLNWAPAALRSLIQSESGAYLGDRASRLVIDGPDIALEPKAFATLALVIHEMMTNSAKYGALADSAGQVTINWRIDPRSGLIIDWRESGGPPVKPPSRRGFGTTIIERSIPFDLNGSADLKFDLLGVRATFVIPARYVQVSGAASSDGSPMNIPAQDSARLNGTALIVEDNLIIAMNAELILLDLGARHVHTASSVKEALSLVEREKPSFALLDLNLGAENSLPVGMKLAELGVPFVFATGYGEQAPIPDELGAVPIVQKPYTIESIKAVLSRLVGETDGKLSD